MCSVIEELKNEGFQQGIQQGIQQGKKQGMQTFADLTKKLLALHRTNDLNRAIEDEQYRDQLMKEFSFFLLNDQIAVQETITTLFCKYYSNRTFSRSRHPHKHYVFFVAH